MALQFCETLGLGVLGNVEVIGGFGNGTLNSGRSTSGGAFIEGGSGFVQGGSVLINDSGAEAATGIFGIGGGGAGGVMSCISQTLCP